MRADLALIQKESARASAIIRNLSRFSPPAGIDADHGVPVAMSSPRWSSCGSAGFTSRTSRSRSRTRRPSAVTAVFTELQQVVLNFVINAEQAVGAQRTGGSPDHHPDARRASGHPSRGRRLRPGCARRARIEALPAVLHDQADRRGHRPRPVGELRHHPLIRRHDRLRAAPLGGALFYFELPAAARRSDGCRDCRACGRNTMTR